MILVFKVAAVIGIASLIARNNYNSASRFLVSIAFLIIEVLANDLLETNIRTLEHKSMGFRLIHGLALPLHDKAFLLPMRRKQSLRDRAPKQLPQEQVEHRLEPRAC
jgi:hypothetical protein